MDKHLYITDLDGTLLKGDKTLSAYTRQQLRYLLKEKKIHFTIATARSYVYAKQVLDGVGLHLPLILKNGAVTSDYSSGRHLNINFIEDEYWRELVDDIGEYMLSPFMSTFNSVDECYYYDQVVGDGMQWYVNEMQAGKDKRLKRLPTLHIVPHTEKVLSVSVINRLEVIEKVQEELQHRYKNILHCHFYEELYHRGWYWAVFTNKAATKDQAIKNFCDQFGYDINETTAFGDSLSDKSMLQVVKHKIAVANADKRLIEIATEVTGSNEEDGVVKYIERKLK
ncbi:MAG TPA: HAD family hydrolase [Bacteroidia bacterium]|nr:HAD family hydrolase [Bacteroidia bacterium]